MDAVPATGQALGDEEFGRLLETAQRELRVGNRELAAEISQQLLDAAPQSTSAHELAGDVLAAQGRRAQARDHYRTAMELEPANADAERKYAEAALMLGSAERTRHLMESGRLEELRGATARNPGAAAARSLFFPGLGQLYNGEYEKGIIACVAGLPLLGLGLWGVTNFIMAASPRATSAPTLTEHLLGLLGIFGYGVLVAWSVWDAWRAGQVDQATPSGANDRG
jgi:tetratricopeptide (TPR) repeat protein